MAVRGDASYYPVGEIRATPTMCAVGCRQRDSECLRCAGGCRGGKAVAERGRGWERPRRRGEDSEARPVGSFWKLQLSWKADG